MNSLFLKTALRNLLKRKGSALLNVLGLMIGISCCLLIFQYVSYERSYDSFQSASSRIYRLRLDQYKQGKLEWKSATVYPAIGPTINRNYPEVEDMCRLYNWSAVFLESRDQHQILRDQGIHCRSIDNFHIGHQASKGESRHGAERTLSTDHLAKSR